MHIVLFFGIITFMDANPKHVFRTIYSFIQDITNVVSWTFFLFVFDKQKILVLFKTHRIELIKISY